MEILSVVLSSGIVAGIMSILLAWLQRKWNKEDAKDDRLEALVTAQKVLMVDRVRYMGSRYIEAGEISLEDKETLKDMYSAYKALGGNGHLETIMSEIDRLHVITRHNV